MIPDDSLFALAYASACLIPSGLFTTLHASLVVAQDAGLSRLPEKFPHAERRLRRWKARWDLLRSGVFLVAMLCAIAAVVFAARAVPPDTAGSRWYYAGVVLAAAILLSLLLKVVPRALSESYADLTSVRYLPVAVLVSRILYPIAWPLSRLEQGLMHWALSGADEENRPSHEDEILHLVDQAPPADIEEDERNLIKSVFAFGDTVARECMTPRIEVDGLADNLTVAEACKILKTSSHSRFPIYHDTLDDVRGYVHVKDLLRLLQEDAGARALGNVARSCLNIPEDLPISEVLQRLRAAKEQAAILVDEYGGTAGLITVEDILEELVGDIHDEYDTETLLLRGLAEGGTLVDARMPVDEVNRRLEITIPESDEYDSLGGFLCHAFERVPSIGETIEGGGAAFRIQSANDRKIQTVEIRTNPDTVPEA